VLKNKPLSTDDSELNLHLLDAPNGEMLFLITVDFYFKELGH